MEALYLVFFPGLLLATFLCDTPVDERIDGTGSRDDE
jgi:hypothetical protein